MVCRIELPLGWIKCGKDDASHWFRALLLVHQISDGQNTSKVRSVWCCFSVIMMMALGVYLM